MSTQDPSQSPQGSVASAPVPGSGRRTRVVAVANQKGGVGKTTTVINLATCLADLGLKALVVDLDPQANSTSGFGLPRHEGVSLYRAMLGEGSASDLVQPTSVEGLDLIPSELDMAGAEVDIAQTEQYLHCFSGALAPLVQAGRYDFIFIDCPPSLGILTMNALTAAHSILVPMQCEYYALEGLSVISRIIQQLRDNQANVGIEIEGILMTMYDGRTNLAAQVVEEVRRHFGDKVYETVIPRNVRLSEAPSHGQPGIRYDRHSSGARAYLQLGYEFLRRLIEKGAIFAEVESLRTAGQAGEGPAAAGDSACPAASSPKTSAV